MKDLSTAEKTADYIYRLRQSQGHSFTKAEYTDDTGADIVISDLQYPISIVKKGKKPKYANINYTPAAATCSFGVINKDGIYSPKNTGSSFNEVFKRDRVVKFYDGKYNPTGDTATSESLDLTTSDHFHYFTKVSGSNVGLDISNTGGNTDDYFSDIITPKYDSETYDDSTYSPEGYVVFKKTLGATLEWTITQLSVTCNNTNGTIYYRFGNSETEMKGAGNSTGWTNAGSTANGTSTIAIANKTGFTRIYIAVIFETGLWGSGMEVSDVSITYQNHIEWVILGTFYLDDPDIEDHQSPKISTLNVTGRNAWKKALETRLNIEDLTSQSAGGMSIDDLIKDLADKANISYGASTIADLSSYGNRTLTSGYDKEEKIEKVIEDIMQIIGKDYRMYIGDDNLLYVTARPSTYSADIVFNFRRYIDARQRFVSDTQLQRFGITDKQGVLTAAQNLASATYSTTGTKTLSWSGNAIAKYVQYTVNSGDAVISSVDMKNESADVVITGTSIDISIAIWGCKYSSGAPTYQGESVNWANLDSGDGVTSRVVNPLVISDAECETISDNFIADYGLPDYNVDLKDSYINALVEINDIAMFVSDDFFEDGLYSVIGITYTMDSEVSKNATFFLQDTGLNFSDQGSFLYDRDFYDTTVTAIDYDIGNIYDANYAIGASASEIGTSQYYSDVDAS